MSVAIVREQDENQGPKRNKFEWEAGDTTVEPLNDATWSTTYVTERGSQALVQDVEEMTLHVMQESAVREQDAQDYLEDFMAGPQAKVMPAEVRRGLKALGVI